MEFTLRQLQYFVAAVELGSVTAAAVRCHSSQGAASMALRQLEKAVGTPLLIRNGSQAAVPTAAGQVFLPHARGLLDRVEIARDSVSESLTSLSGPLRAGVSVTLSPRLAPPLALHFARHHPEVELDITEGSPEQLQAAVLTGRADVAFLYRWQVGPELNTTEIAPVHLHLILPAGHRLADRTEISLHEVIDEPAILLEVPPTAQRMREVAASLGLELKVAWRSANMETIRAMVAAGLGFSFANSLPAGGSTFSGDQVVYRPLSDPLAENSIVAARLPGRAARRVEAAVEALIHAER